VLVRVAIDGHICIASCAVVFIWCNKLYVPCVRAGFRSRRTLPEEYRVKQLRVLWRMIEENKERSFEAVWKDLRKVGCKYLWY